jgi:hypothetical protein
LNRTVGYNFRSKSIVVHETNNFRFVILSVAKDLAFDLALGGHGFSHAATAITQTALAAEVTRD